MFKQWLLALCVSGFALSACAAPDGTAAGQQSTATGAERPSAIGAGAPHDTPVRGWS